MSTESNSTAGQISSAQEGWIKRLLFERGFDPKLPLSTYGINDASDASGYIKACLDGNPEVGTIQPIADSQVEEIQRLVAKHGLEERPMPELRDHANNLLRKLRQLDFARSQGGVFAALRAQNPDLVPAEVLPGDTEISRFAPSEVDAQSIPF